MGIYLYPDFIYLFIYLFWAQDQVYAFTNIYAHVCNLYVQVTKNIHLSYQI